MAEPGRPGPKPQGLGKPTTVRLSLSQPERLTALALPGESFSATIRRAIETFLIWTETVRDDGCE